MTTPARELDAYLAEHLFGLSVHEVATSVYLGYGNVGEEKVLVVENGPVYEDLPNYSATGDGMLMVIEAMKTKGYEVSFTDWGKDWSEGYRYHARFHAEGKLGGDVWEKTIPTAVALAAKAALEGQAHD